MRQKMNSHRIVVGIAEGRDDWKYLDVVGRVILKRILEA
jgi:hypothetical protein